jgi:hypothetical protein
MADWQIKYKLSFHGPANDAFLLNLLKLKGPVFLRGGKSLAKVAHFALNNVAVTHAAAPESP